MNGRDPLICSQVVFAATYGLELNQNLVQDVQGLSWSYALKKAGSPNFFIDLVRPKVELNHDSCMFFGGIMPLEIFSHKITILILICYFT